MALVSCYAPEYEGFVEFDKTVSLNGFLFDKVSLFPTMYSTNLEKRILFAPISYVSPNICSYSAAFNNKTFSFPVAADERFNLLKTCLVRTLDSGNKKFAFVAAASSGDPCFVVRLYSGTDTQISFEKEVSFDGCPVLMYLADVFPSNQDFMVVYVGGDDKIRFARVPPSGDSYSLLLSDDTGYITHTFPSAIKYLGWINSNHYFATIATTSNVNERVVRIYKVDVSTQTASLEHEASLSGYDIDSTVDAALVSLKREDGAIYTFCFYPGAASELKIRGLLIETGGNINEIDVSLDFGEHQPSYILAGLQGSLQGVGMVNGEKAVLLSLSHTYRIVKNANNIPCAYFGYASSWFKSMFSTWQFDEGQSKMVLKDLVKTDLRPVNFLLPLDNSMSKFYVHYVYGLGKLSVNSEFGIKLVPVVTDNRYMFVGFTSDGKMWGVTSDSIELLPFYRVAKAVNITWEREDYNFQGEEINTHITVSVADEDGNAISGRVRLSVLTSNAIFSDSSSYELTVDVPEDGATIPVKITGPGLIVLESTILE
jgi:hypothetical protein